MYYFILSMYYFAFRECVMCSKVMRDYFIIHIEIVYDKNLIL